MCKKSLKTGECDREYCRFLHIKNTSVPVRTKRNPTHTDKSSTPDTPTGQTSVGTKPEKTGNTPSPNAQLSYASAVKSGGTMTSNADDFLDVRSLGSRMATMMTRMDNLLQQLQTPTYTVGQNHPLQQILPFPRQHSM